VRNASTYSVRFEEKSPEHYTKFHEVKTADWKYVDRLIPPLVIPDYPVKDSYVSGWKPPADSALSNQFFVKRTKNHMIPVYLNFEAVRDQRKITLIKNIEGDIWELERLLKEHIQTTQSKTIISQVHEVAMQIKFRGDYVNIVKKWLLDRGF